jgi:hypothetical protein
LEATKLPANPPDIRLELAYDVLFYCVMAMLEASKLELDSDRGHHRDAMQHLITTLRLRGKNEEGVMALYASADHALRRSSNWNLWTSAGCRNSGRTSVG